MPRLNTVRKLPWVWVWVWVTLNASDYRANGPLTLTILRSSYSPARYSDAFLPRDGMQSAVMKLYDVCPSVQLYVCNV